MSEFEALGPGGTEAQFQQFLAYLFAQTSSTGLAATGVLVGLGVTQTATPSGEVLVAAGMGVCQDTVLNGATPLINNTIKTQDVLTANPAAANPRNDIVVFDSTTKSISVITGSANAIPTDPTIPATAIPLARLRVAANATSIPAANIDDLRVYTSLAQSTIAKPMTELRGLDSTWSKAVSGNTVTNVRWAATPTVNTLALTRTDSATLTVPTGKGGLYEITATFTFTASAAERRFMELFVTSSVLTYRSVITDDGQGAVSAVLRLSDGDGLRVQCYAASAATASNGQWTIVRIGE